jgi:hypothetical protein
VSNDLLLKEMTTEYFLQQTRRGRRLIYQGKEKVL